jgi:hypothetical protein
MLKVLNAPPQNIFKIVRQKKEKKKIYVVAKTITVNLSRRRRRQIDKESTKLHFKLQIFALKTRKFIEGSFMINN